MNHLIAVEELEHLGGLRLHPPREHGQRLGPLSGVAGGGPVCLVICGGHL